MSDPVIIIDSREQRPWSFSPDVRTEVDGLKTGDYSLKGFEEQVAIERKSLDDLVGSLTQGRRRFMAEMERLLEIPVRALIVEATTEEILQQRYRSRAHPSSIMGSCVSLIRRGIPVLFASNRYTAATWAERLLLQEHKRLLKEGRGVQVAVEAGA